jgi:hypothetical protein
MEADLTSPTHTTRRASCGFGRAPKPMRACGAASEARRSSTLSTSTRAVALWQLKLPTWKFTPHTRTKLLFTDPNMIILVVVSLKNK